MKELSLNILDIAENSVKAGATVTQITLTETDDTLTISVKDDGCGMDAETLKRVQDPFYTTRTTRKVGMGIPLFKMAAEQTGGSFSITSVPKQKNSVNHGTETTAVFFKNHIDSAPLGDVVATVTTLIQGHSDTDFVFTHIKQNGKVFLDTREIRAELGDEISLAEYEIIKWIEEFLNEQYINL